MLDTLVDLGIVILIPVARSVIGWAENALVDKKIDEFEWKQLLETVLRVGTMGVLAYMGLSAAGTANAGVIAGTASFFADKIFMAMKK